MWRAVALFRIGEDEDGPKYVIDSLAQAPWDYPPDFLSPVEAVKKLTGVAGDMDTVFKTLLREKPMTPEQEKLLEAAKHMSLRARFNQDVRGPFYFSCEEEMSEELLLDAYEKQRKARIKRATKKEKQQ